ncbi:TPA: hypothetical protein JBF91_03075 [Legionella pneumophila]|nr:hypothetical protein [Legionella pneumophila]
MSRKILVVLLVSFGCFANQTGTDFESYKNYADSLKNKTTEAMRGFDPSATFQQGPAGAFERKPTVLNPVAPSKP